MGACESLLNTEKDKIGFKDKNKQTNKGPNLFSAQIDSSQKNTIFFSSCSKSTMSNDTNYQDQQKPQLYTYINKYKTNVFQRSIAKASLAELGHQENSLLNSNQKNSVLNLTNSMYTSKYDDTGYESSYEGIEMITDGKMDEDIIKKSKDQNTINNYNEFILKKDNNNNLKTKKSIDYYYKANMNHKNNEALLDDNKDQDEMSEIAIADTN